MKLKCSRCNHTWISRLSKRKPVACPHCKNTRWNKPKNKTKKMNV